MNRFINAVNDETERAVTEIQQLAESAYDDIVKQANDESIKQAYDTMQHMVHDLEVKYARMVTKAELEAKKDLLRYRERLMNGMFDHVKERLEAFTEGSDYAKYLTKVLAAVKVSGTASVYVRSKDEATVGKLLKDLKLDWSIVVNADIILGGISVLDMTKNRLLDYTFDTKLDEVRAAFNSRNVLPLPV